MPHLASPTDNLAKLADESRTTIAQLEERMSAIASAVKHEQKGEYFLLGTADLQASVYYAPLYNLPQSILQKIGGGNNHTLLREIREKFLMRVGPTGFLREVCRSIRESPDDDGNLFFVQVGRTGDVRGVECFDSQNQSQDPSQIVQDTLVETPHLGPELAELITDWRSGLEYNGRELHTFFLIRAEPRFQGPQRSAELDIMQVGVAFLQSKKLSKRKVSVFQGLAQTSSFATISLLYEKERYYEKAIRQAVKGSIIKYGERVDIGNQVQILRKLQDAKRWNVPAILGVDPLLDSRAQEHVESPITTANEFAWYSMPWFVIPSLMDTLSLTEGFEKYEIAAVIRSGFKHIHHNYWGDNILPAAFPLRPSLLVPLALAIDVAETTFDGIASQKETILGGIPVKLSRGIDVFSKAHLKRHLKVLNPILDRDSFALELSWNHTPLLTNQVSDPIKQLKDLFDIIADMSNQEDVLQLRIRGDGNLHGDAHFGNLLVDASVPEDPFIISIDPTKIKSDTLLKQIKKPARELVEKLCGASSSDEQFDFIPWDLSYDVAKFALSASCCYGLVYRNGFVIKPPEKEGSVFQLTMNEEDGPEKPKDAGGISGAQIVRIGPKVHLDAWANHSIAANRTLLEYLTLQHRYRGKATDDCFHRTVNVGLIRLWFLTVRHVFSIAGKLFPVKMEEATVMYLIGTLFVNRGLPTIKKILSNNIDLNIASIEQKLTDLFFWETNVDV